jgi:hypothetical protein
MPAYVTGTIIWTFVIAFIACIAGGVLMIFGVWEPKDPAVRKWLLRGVVISVVGAVVAFGVRQFAPTTNPSSQEPTNSPQQPQRPPPGQPRPQPATGRPGQPQGGATPEQPAAVPQPPPVPDDLKDWAENELGPRPMLPDQVEQQYPPCAAQLSGRDPGETDAADALSCRRDLQKFHLDVVVAYYDTKRPYDRNLEAQEGALRKGGLQPDELPKYNYIIAEMDRLNGEDSPEENALHSLEERLLADIRRCSKSACR